MCLPIYEAVADRVCLSTMYDVRSTIWEVPALARECGEVCRLASLAFSFMGNAWGNVLNEPGEIFIGTCVGVTVLRSRKRQWR